jgi:hypothetical protein
MLTFISNTWLEENDNFQLFSDQMVFASVGWVATLVGKDCPFWFVRTGSEFFRIGIGTRNYILKNWRS